MRHYLFAVLPDPAHAAHAVDALSSSGAPAARCQVLVHADHLRSEEIPVGESALRVGALAGALVVGASALGVTLALGALGVVGAGFGWTAALAGSVGALMGAVFGGIAGASSPHRALDRLERELRAGRVVVSVEAPDADCLRVAERTLEREGARVLVRPAI